MTMTEVPLAIKCGLPYTKQFAVTLPDARSWWLDLSDFEVLSQIREKDERDSGLVLDIADFFTVTMPSANLVNVVLAMTGADTRLVTKSGHYDILLSDTGETDERSYVISKGPVRRTTIVTAATKDEA